MIKLHKLSVKINKIPNILRSVNKSSCTFQSNRDTSSNASQNGNETKRHFTNFNDFMTERRNEAERSILVQVNSEKSYPELQTYCSKFGKIQKAYHYSIRNDDLHYIMIEYTNRQHAVDILNSSQFNDDGVGVPVRSPFLWFRAAGKTKSLKQSKQPTNVLIENSNEVVTNEELISLLQSADTVTNQILILFRSTCLNDLGVRLRFLAAKQIETAMSGMFPAAKTLPFGSSVNGFGKMGCDLDLILRLEDEIVQDAQEQTSRLVFHTKQNLANGRSQTQRQMESIGDMLQLFLPGVGHVRRILQARVPIIKYHHEHLDLEVDLSMSNMTGVYMSEILYMFGQMDDRVRPLTFCIRKWAQSVGLTNPSPGRWITNFSLTALVIFYLQQLKDPILPSINLLTQKANKDEIRITEDDINCTYLRDLNRLDFMTSNTDTLDHLLLQFFEYYSQFDFHNSAISLNEGKIIPKPDHCAIYIVNPLESFLNVSKNISYEELERFRIEVRNSAWILESNQIQKTTGDTNWGVLNLLKVNNKQPIRPAMFFKSRMVEVSELFSDDHAVDVRQTSNQNVVNFKNPQIKTQVNGIKAKGRHDLKQIKELSSRGKR